MIVETLQQKTQTSTRTKRTGGEAGTEDRCQENFGICKKVSGNWFRRVERPKFKLRREISRIRSSRWIFCCRTPTGVSLKMEMSGTENRRCSWRCLCLRGGETLPETSTPRRLPPLQWKMVGRSNQEALDSETPNTAENRGLYWKWALNERSPGRGKCLTHVTGLAARMMVAQFMSSGRKIRRFLSREID